MTKTLSKSNKLTKSKKRGWFTKEAMARVLNWSASFVPNTCVARFQFEELQLGVAAQSNLSHPRSYIKSVVEYCEKPGNVDRLVKNLSCTWLQKSVEI